MNRRHVAFCAVLLFVSTLVLSPTPAAENTPETDHPLRSPRAAIRAREYNSAIQEIDGLLGKADTPTDEALYLKALALHHLEEYERAVQVSDQLIKQHSDSAWFRKARFLKASALTEQRKFEVAEKIYEEEASRLLSEGRKQDIAGVLVKFADALSKKPAPDDVGAPPPNYGKAYQLYQKALELEIGRELRDDLLFKRARTVQLAGNYAQAIRDYRTYLEEFDPDWMGPVGSARRMAGQKRENPVEPGEHVAEARYQLAESQLNAGDRQSARVNLEDLLGLMSARKWERPELVADSRWLLVKTYNMPNTQPIELEKAVQQAEQFLDKHRSDPRAVVAAYWIAKTYDARGRADAAVERYRSFIADETFSLPEGDAATEDLQDFDKSPAELRDNWRKFALYRIGQIRFQQKNYEGAREAWQRYIARHPDGPHWSSCQQGIINTEYRAAVDAVADKDYDEARDRFEAFLTAHPLDDRVRRVLFTLGQIEYVRAEKLEKAEEPEDQVQQTYQKAIDRWQRLVGKYPRTEESSLALYRIGTVHEEKLGELEKALEAYRRLNWGSYAQQAQARISLMTEKQLEVRTKRTFRTTEQPRIQLNLRNIDKVTLKQYFLDLEAYFRKTHGTGNVRQLDTDLIEPDETWEVPVEGYEKYLPIEQQLEIPFQDGAPGVCVINVSEEDYQATTLVIRSDLEIIARTSRREALVFAQNAVEQKGMPEVQILLSDGKKVFGTGNTGDDGVYHRQFDELKETSNLRVFASKEGHVASNALNMSGLQFSEGLAPKGYIYTDRPAYKPGQTVKFRAIIRGIKEGSYAVPTDTNFLASVTDSQGRMLWEKAHELSEFGTFHAQVPLDEQAPVGQYTITVRDPDDSSVAYSSTFQVQHFKLEKMRLVMETERDVYFRSEIIDLSIRAEYYWGQPVPNKRVRYDLPDGRHFVEETDASGTIEVSYDTSGLQPGRALPFTASIEGENVRDSHSVFLARNGYSIDIRTNRDLVLAGEPFDAVLTTTTPGGDPVGQTLRVLVLKRETSEPDPVLNAVPWISLPSRPAAEVTVEERQVTTDEDTGEGTVRLTLEDGGRYIIRASGQDRFDQVITAQTTLTVSDDEDETKLRFFAETDTLKVGAQAEIRLHSRLESELALLTWEGEDILDYAVISLDRGYNPLKLDVQHKHFPNFSVAVSAIEGRELRTASRPFTVERELKVKIEPQKKAYAPGAAGEVHLTVTDQLGNPVRGEFSLALVDEALFAIYPDQTPPILDFFQKDARRHAEFRAASSCGFHYSARAREVIQAYRKEAERLERRLEEAKKMDKLRTRLEAAAEPEGGPGAARREMPEAEEEMRDEALSGRGQVAVFGAKTGSRRRAEARPAPRRELPEAGWWTGSVVTGENGKATIEVPMPDKTTEWRLSARGCTVETLLGESTASVVTRRDFFVSMKMPGQLQEGDSFRLLARVHNLQDTAGKADVEMTVFSGETLESTLAERSSSVDIQSNGTAKVLFDAVEVPLNAALKVRLRASFADRSDALETVIPVRPWGLEFADQSGGTARGDATAMLELPDDRKYASRWLTVSVGPDLKRSVIQMALHNTPRPIPMGRNRCTIMPPVHPRIIGSDLLATVNALKYARKVDAPAPDIQALSDRARSLVSALVVSQRGDGGWTWTRADNYTDWAVTAMNFWGLCRAKQAGIEVRQPTRDKARTYLQNKFTQVSTNDNDAKAVILHALSVDGAADFAHANRLHRERNGLSAPALAYTALTFANLERNEFAAEILGVLEEKAAIDRSGDKTLRHWAGSGSYAWLNDSLETTAVATLALMKVRPDSTQVQEAIAYIMDQHGSYGFVPAKAHGPAVSAVAAYHGTTRFAGADYRLDVVVNGEKLETIQATGARDMVHLPVPQKMVREGRNTVEFRMEGRGEYAYSASLRGFSKQISDPKSWGRPYVRSRHYYHSPLTYRGRSIGVRSTSPVQNVEIGQRIEVRVDIYDYVANKNYFIIEEPIPAGMMFVRGSLSGNFDHHEVRAGKLVMYFRPRRSISDFHYELVGYATGEYRILPTVIQDALHPERMRIGEPARLTVLAPDEKSQDPYKMNRSEHYALGKRYFDDGLYDEALPHVRHLFDYNRQRRNGYQEREVARMMLWIHTSEGYYDARQIVQSFEVLRERYPQLEIPFDRILVAGRAYRDIGELERAYLIYRATIDASFINDSNVSAVLEDQGQFLGSIDYQRELWWEYPDTSQVASAYFALAQGLYEKAPQAEQLAEQARRLAKMRDSDGPDTSAQMDRIDMLAESKALLRRFLTLYPQNPLADDAAFSIANVSLELKQYEEVVRLGQAYAGRYPDSELAGGFRYMTALGHFWLNQYEEAIDAAKSVAGSQSKDRFFARYIVGQIYHALGKPPEAIEWYKKVADRYPDAGQAIEYFQRKSISIEEVSIFRPGEEVELDIDYRNVKEAFCQIYRVDLMKLYLREKNLADITRINLAGIEPLLEKTVDLGEGKDFADREKTTALDLGEEGAYLVICRGENLFTSGMVLVTPLKIEVQEDAGSGRVRANVINAVTDAYVPEVHVKAIGSAQEEFRSGDTDLRGIFVADDIRGKATVIARQGESRYAFYRGETWLGAPPEEQRRRAPSKEGSRQLDYQANLRAQQQAIQQKNYQQFDQMRRQKSKGVQVQKAY